MTLQFAEYFRFYQLGSWVYAPIIKVDKKSPYKVQEFFLDDVNNKKLDNYKSDVRTNFTIEICSNSFFMKLHLDLV